MAEGVNRTFQSGPAGCESVDCLSPCHLSCETCRAIIDATEHPMSIIIIGIGDANFGAMHGLDGDGGYALSVGRKTAKRDIVQFVPFNEHRNGPTLAAEVLKELPDQICEYMMCGLCCDAMHSVQACLRQPILFFHSEALTCSADYNSGTGIDFYPASAF